MRYQINFFYLSPSLILNRGNGFNKRPWLLLPFFSLLSHFSVLFMVMRPFFPPFTPKGHCNIFYPCNNFRNVAQISCLNFLVQKYFLVEKKRFYEVSSCTCLTSGGELCWPASRGQVPNFLTVQVFLSLPLSS